MYIRNVFVAVLATAGTSQAFDVFKEVRSVADTSKRTLESLFNSARSIIDRGDKTAACPAVWIEISTTLTAQFLADGQCTDAARAAIRGAFHDCFNGACDGSLILANECSNTENRGLERLCGNLATVQSDNEVGMADLIQFAAAHAIKTCPGGPIVPVKVGRKDSSNANALGVLPSPNDSGDALVKLFGKYQPLFHHQPTTNLLFSIKRFLPN